MLGNPRFLVVLAIELAMGSSAKWSAEVQTRGKQFWPVRSAAVPQSRGALSATAQLHRADH